MHKKQLEKNILDLKYHFESQKINALLILLTVGVLAFLGTVIWYRERLFFGIGLSLIIIIISLIVYKRTRKKMEKIIGDLRKLSK